MVYLRTEAGQRAPNLIPGSVDPKVRTALAAAGLALAVLLVWAGISVHLERACTLNDTDYLPLCAPALPDSDPNRVRELRDRLGRDPGDSVTWVDLANLGSADRQQALLNAIAVLAPVDPNSLRLRARRALEEQQWPAAVDLLVAMTEHGIGGDEPPQLLARLLASGQAEALLRPHLLPESRWLPQVLAGMTSLKLPLDAGLSLLAEAIGKSIVTPDTVRLFIRSLKAAGKWADAYGLWLAEQGRAAPLLFNGNFEKSFQPDGFDWELTGLAPSRAGAAVQRRSLVGHGRVLEIQYLGRGLPGPLVRQMLFLSPGRYRFQGQYTTSKLRAEEGLAWAVRCTGTAAPLAGRSGALKDTGGAWQDFAFEFDIPASCGPVASLQLETYAPYEASTGFRGTASFDNFELRSLGS
jgi:hypothetical protein